MEQSKPKLQLRYPNELSQIKSSIIDAIECKRGELGISQRAMAEKIGLPQPRYNNLCNKKLEVFSVDKLIQIALQAGLKISVITL